MGTYDLTTAALVKAHEGITGSGDDTLIGKLIERATGLIEQYVGMPLKKRTYTYASGHQEAIYDGLSGRNRSRLPLAVRPISSITTVRINEFEIPASGGVHESGWYIQNKKAGIVGLRGYEWIASPNGIELVFAAGYDSTETETEWSALEHACILQTMWMFKQGKQGHMLGVSSVGHPDGSVAVFASDGLLEAVKQILDPFRCL